MPALSILTFLESEIAIKVIIDYSWQIIMLIFGDPENENVTDWCLRTRVEKQKKLKISDQVFQIKRMLLCQWLQMLEWSKCFFLVLDVFHLKLFWLQII